MVMNRAAVRSGRIAAGQDSAAAVQAARHHIAFRRGKTLYSGNGAQFCEAQANCA